MRGSRLRSKGCYTCRKVHKLKCDEVKPICSRCQRTGEPCAYPDASDIIFRDENESAAANATARWRRRAAERASDSTDMAIAVAVTKPSTKTTASQTALHPCSSFVLALGNRRPSTTAQINDLALAFFKYEYVNGSTSMTDPQHLSFVPALYDAAKPNSYLRRSVMAAALAHLASKARVTTLKDRAAASYVTALTHVTKALQNVKMDEMVPAMLSVQMLGLYEASTHNRLLENSWRVHVDGAMRLLTARSKEALLDPISLLLFIRSFMPMLMVSIAKKQRPSYPLKIWTDNIAAPLPFNYQAILLYRIAEFNADVHAALSSNTPATLSTLEAFKSLGEHLDAQCKAWLDALPTALFAPRLALAASFALPAPLHDIMTTTRGPELFRIFPYADRATLVTHMYAGRAHLNLALALCCHRGAVLSLAGTSTTIAEEVRAASFADATQRAHARAAASTQALRESVVPQLCSAPARESFSQFTASPPPLSSQPISTAYLTDVTDAPSSEASSRMGASASAASNESVAADPPARLGIPLLWILNTAASVSLGLWTEEGLRGLPLPGDNDGGGINGRESADGAQLHHAVLFPVRLLEYIEQHMGIAVAGAFANNVRGKYAAFLARRARSST